MKVSRANPLKLTGPCLHGCILVRRPVRVDSTGRWNMSRNAKLVAVDDALYAAARNAQTVALDLFEDVGASEDERDHAQEILDVCKVVLNGTGPATDD